MNATIKPTNQQLHPERGEGLFRNTDHSPNFDLIPKTATQIVGETLRDREPKLQLERIFNLLADDKLASRGDLIGAALAALPKIPGLIEIVAGHADDPNHRVRAFVYRALVALENLASVKCRGALPILRRILSTSGGDDQSARLCIRLIEKIGPGESEWMEIILAGMTNPSLTVKSEAARALAGFLMRRNGNGKESRGRARTDKYETNC